MNTDFIGTWEGRIKPSHDPCSLRFPPRGQGCTGIFFPSYLYQLLHMSTQGDPVRFGCHARGPLHHQGRFEGGGWLGQGQRGTVSQCMGLRWRSEVRGHVSPDSWDSGAPGRKRVHRSRPPCRRDPGKAGGGQGVTDHPCLRPTYSLCPARIPTLILFPRPSSLGPPRSSLPLSPPSLSTLRCPRPARLFLPSSVSGLF